jgi:nucleotide-binding universal stress UspA family protein
MKTIVAPVDFSDASANALLFAAELAKRSSAHLIVSHFLEQKVKEQEANDKLKSVVSGLKESHGAGLSCEAMVVRGSLTAGLKKIVKASKADLTVMGTKGASGLKRILIGSNTVDVMAKVKIPVLVIPETARFDDFLRNGKSRIVLAADLGDLENYDALDVLKEIALLIIKPKLRVLSVRPKNSSLDYLKEMERRALLSVFSDKIETERITVFSRNVMSGINFYLNKNKDTGLVAMIARDSGHLIQKHYTREMASHTNFPLLVLHDS